MRFPIGAGRGAVLPFRRAVDALIGADTIPACGVEIPTRDFEYGGVDAAATKPNRLDLRDANWTYEVA